jgi:hypothetical protein
MCIATDVISKYLRRLTGQALEFEEHLDGAQVQGALMQEAADVGTLASFGALFLCGRIFGEDWIVILMLPIAAIVGAAASDWAVELQVTAQCVASLESSMRAWQACVCSAPSRAARHACQGAQLTPCVVVLGLLVAGRLADRLGMVSDQLCIGYVSVVSSGGLVFGLLAGWFADIAFFSSGALAVGSVVYAILPSTFGIQPGMAAETPSTQTRSLPV